MIPVKPPGVILLIASAREFDRGMRRGIFEFVQAHDPWVFHEETLPYQERLTTRRHFRYQHDWNAQGMIVQQSRLAEVKSLRIPTVVTIEMRGLGTGSYQVVCANEEIGLMGARDLMGRGLRHFAYCGLEGLEFSENRSKGFVGGVQAAGYSAKVYSPPARHPSQSSYRDQRRLARWLSALPKPTGLMACNDDRAFEIAKTCRALRIRVPDDIAILGVDNDEHVCRSATPPLSSIALATERGGYEAASLLADLMSGHAPAAKVITVHPTHTVHRQSTDILAIDDPVVVRVLRFIREHSNRSLQVADLLAVAGISRRALQDRFKRCLGRPLLDEIHRCRVDRLARLLLETNMTIGQIAAATGFEIDAHVSRFFSRQTGMTPLTYRRKHRAT